PPKAHGASGRIVIARRIRKAQCHGACLIVHVVRFATYPFRYYRRGWPSEPPCAGPRIAGLRLAGCCWLSNHSACSASTAQSRPISTECKAHIARKERLIRRLNQRGQESAWAKNMLEALQSSLRAFEAHRNRLMMHTRGKSG